MKIIIGKVLKPQGINGEIKVKRLCDGADALQNVKKVFIGEKEYKLHSVIQRGEELFFRLFMVADRNAAELLRGQDVYCEKDELLKEDGRFFIADVLGCDLYLSSGKKIGEIIDIAPSNYDIYTLSTSEGEANFPLLKSLNPIFDIENKKVTVDSKKFTEVVTYSDNEELKK